MNQDSEKKFFSILLKSLCILSLLLFIILAAIAFYSRNLAPRSVEVRDLSFHGTDYRLPFYTSGISEELQTAQSGDYRLKREDVEEIDGLDLNGWTRILTCNSTADPLIYAGASDDEDYAVICELEGKGILYYKGYFHGGASQHLIASASPTYKTAPASDGTYIEVIKDTLTVYSGDGEALIEAHYPTYLDAYH